MRIKIGSGLLLLNLLTVLLAAAVAFSLSGVLRIALGLPSMLFFPGYALVLVLFPGKEGLGGIERAVLSLGLSVVMVPLVGFILSYTERGITPETFAYSLASLIVILSIIAWFRRWRLPKQARFGIELQLNRPFLGTGIWTKTLSIILVVSILGALGVLGYFIANPRTAERFTEFYILGLDGKAEGYPKELVVGETGWVIVGIINHEREPVTYRMEVVIDGIKNNGVDPVTLENDGKLEMTIGFTPGRPGDNQTVEFLLYYNEDSEAYLTLNILVNVTDRTAVK